MRLLVLIAVLLLMGCEEELDKPAQKYRKAMQTVTIIGTGMEQPHKGTAYPMVRYVVAGYEEIVQTDSRDNLCSEYKLLTPGTAIDVAMYEYLDDDDRVIRLRTIKDMCQLALTGKIRPKIKEPVNRESP